MASKVSMNETQSMLFSLQRFQILALFSNTAAERTVSDTYAYAWLQSVYPLLNESAPWHKPFAGCFAVSGARLGELKAFLYDRWCGKQPITFYELEDHYGIRGSRRPGPVSGERWVGTREPVAPIGLPSWVLSWDMAVLRRAGAG